MPTTTKISTKDHILSAAAELIGRMGYHGASMRDLAAAVNLEPASLYGHFKGKEAILWELAMHCANDFHDTVNPIYTGPLNTREKLKEMIIAHVQVLIRNITAAPVFNQEWKQLQGEQYRTYAGLRDQYEEMFREVIRLGITEHLFKDMDEKFATLTVLSALNFMPQWYRPDGEKSPEELGEMLASTLINGLLRSF